MTQHQDQPDSREGFTVTRADRAASAVEVGAVVYRCKGWDYGCANDDTRHTGIEHTSVTLDPAGGYPFFTIPKADLRCLTTPTDLGEGNV
jgi:hypothetical protein